MDQGHGSAPSPIIQTAATGGVSQQVEASQNGSQPGVPPADSDSLLISAAANVLPIQQVNSLPLAVYQIYCNI